jgi:hypothetical protein
MSDQRRVLVEFASEGEAERAMKQLRSAGEVQALGGSVSMPGSEPVLSVYVPDSSAAGPVAAAVRRGTVAAGVEPLSVRVDEWLPDEMRWSGHRRGSSTSSGGSDLDVVPLIVNVIGGLLEGPWT